jgi:hypothetical protein
MQASMTGAVIVEKKISQLAAKASEQSIVYVQYCNAKTIGRRIDRFRTVLGTIIPTHCQPLLMQATTRALGKPFTMGQAIMRVMQLGNGPFDAVCTRPVPH